MPAGLLGLIVVIAIAGVLLWAISAFPALDATLKQIIRILVIVVVAIYVIMFVAGLFSGGLGFGHPIYPHR